MSCVGDVVLPLYSTLQSLCLHTLAFLDLLFQQRKPEHVPLVLVSHQEDDDRAPFTGPSKGFKDPTLRTWPTSGSQFHHTALYVGPALVRPPFASFQQWPVEFYFTSQLSSRRSFCLPLVLFLSNKNNTDLPQKVNVMKEEVKFATRKTRGHINQVNATTIIGLLMGGKLEIFMCVVELLKIL